MGRSRKRRITFFFICIIGALLLIASGCSAGREPSVPVSADGTSPGVAQEKEEPAAPPITKIPEKAPDEQSTPPEQMVSPEQSAPPSVTEASVANTVFLGNSCIGDIYKYGLIPEAACYYRVGLDVKSAFTKTAAGGSVPMIEELNQGTYEKVFLMFGENELGWIHPDSFARQYGLLIDAVRVKQPDAEVYVLSILPVTEAVSLQNKNCISMDRINEFNGLLTELAQEKSAVFVDVASSVKNEKGFLPEGVSSDGIHMNKEYCAIWVEYLKGNL